MKAKITFYKEEKFKETPIGKIPEDWNTVKLGNAFNFKRGFSYRSDQITKNPTKIRLITIDDLEKEGGLKRGAEKIYIKENISVDPNFFLNDNDVLIASTDMSKGFIIGAPILVKNEILLEDRNDKLVYSMDLTRLLFDKSKIDSKFLFYYLLYKPVRQKMKNFAQGTNVLHLNHSLVKNLRMPLPSLSEQEAIARILSTIDETIQKTDEIIEKTQRLKKGLMQELLTKGIGHKEFKNTEIGRIPKEWEVVRLSNIVMELKPGFACGKRDENGVIQFRMDSIRTDGWINTKAFVKIPIPDNINVEEYLLKPGDILFTNTSGSLELIGKTALYRGEFKKCVYSNHLTRIRVREETALSEWVFYILLKYWSSGLFKVLKVTQAGGQKSVGKNVLLHLKIPLPSINEQERITRILSTIDKRFIIEEKKKEKLERIKKALMDLLLTGRIRVKVS